MAIWHDKKHSSRDDGTARQPAPRCCWRSMNTPPYYKFKLPREAWPALKRPNPALLSKISFLLLSRKLFFFSFFCLKMVPLNSLTAVPSKKKEKRERKIKKKKPRNWEGSERRQRQSYPRHLSYICWEWWDVPGNKAEGLFCAPPSEPRRWEMSLLWYVCLSFVQPAGFYTIADG